MGGLSVRTAARLQFGDLGSLFPTDPEGGFDQSFANALASGGLIDHHLIQPSLDPEGGRIDDQGGGAQDLVALAREEEGCSGIGQEPFEALHVRDLKGWVELRKQSRERSQDFGRRLTHDLDPHVHDNNNYY